MALPNIYFFARGAYDLAYLDKTNEEILTDFANFLGGQSNLLVPAWDCFQRDLESLPADLPQHLRTTRLTSESAKFIPCGPERYLEILALQVESRIKLLQAISKPAITDEQAAIKITDGITALMDWWNVHRYVKDGNVNEPFDLRFVHESQVTILQKWSIANVKNPKLVLTLAAQILSEKQILTESQACKILEELFPE
jgi:hypothetical protein